MRKFFEKLVSGVVKESLGAVRESLKEPLEAVNEVRSSIEIVKKEIQFRKTFAFWSIQWSLSNAVIWRLTEDSKDQFWPKEGYTDFWYYDITEFFIFVLFPVTLLFSLTLSDTCRVLFKRAYQSKYIKRIFFILLAHQWLYALCVLGNVIL